MKHNSGIKGTDWWISFQSFARTQESRFYSVAFCSVYIYVSLYVYRLLAGNARPPPSWGILQTYPLLTNNLCHIKCKMFALCIWWPKCMKACYMCYPPPPMNSVKQIWTLWPKMNLLSHLNITNVDIIYKFGLCATSWTCWKNNFDLLWHYIRYTIKGTPYKIVAWLLSFIFTVHKKVEIIGTKKKSRKLTSIL